MSLLDALPFYCTGNRVRSLGRPERIRLGARCSAYRQGQAACAGVDRQLDRLRRRPDQGPVGGRDGNANPVSRQERVASLDQWYGDLEALPRRQRLWRLAAIPVMEVQDGVGHPLRDRTRGVEGKGGSVRVDLGGRRVIKKKNRNE